MGAYGTYSTNTQYLFNMHGVNMQNQHSNVVPPPPPSSNSSYNVPYAQNQNNQFPNYQYGQYGGNHHMIPPPPQFVQINYNQAGNQRISMMSQYSTVEGGGAAKAKKKKSFETK